MERSFSVSIRNKHAGKVLVQKQGLYYFFSCRCHLTGGSIYRLMINNGSDSISLGILVPEGDCFVLNTKLPAKRIGDGELSFYLISPKDERSGTFVPISPEEPFAYISRIKRSYLVIRNGQTGICI